jgi:hypothetical protein
MWIEFSGLDFKLLVILIFPLFVLAEEYTNKLYLVDDKLLFISFKNFLSYILSFIFLIISYYNNKPKVIKLELDNENSYINNVLTLSSFNNEIGNEIDELKKDINKKRNIKGAIYLIVLCVIGLGSYLYRLFFEDKNFEFAKQSIGVFFEIFFYVSLSYLILKQKLYKHNFISLIVIAISLIIIFIISVFHIEGKYILNSILYFIFYSFLFSFYDVLGKKYMNDIYKTPYFMMLVIGLVNSFLLIIYDLFAYFFNREISGIIIGFQNNITSAGTFFAFVLNIIVNFIWNLGIWLTVYYFTPCHFFISEYIAEYIKYLTNIRNSTSGFYTTHNIIFFSFFYFINFFCFLVFNEIIILNFWNLDYNTKKRIRNRMKFDDESLKKEIPLINVNSDDDLDNKIE